MLPRHDPDLAYFIDTNTSLFDIPLIHRYLSQSSYWARGRSLETTEKSIRHSLSFGVSSPEGKQIGFGRVVTDYSTFAWLCDVFILEQHRGRGLGKRLVEAVVSHPDLKEIRRILLATSDAHDLYRRYGGFGAIANPETWMERVWPMDEQPGKP